MLKVKKYKVLFKKYRFYLAGFILAFGTFLLPRIPYFNLLLLYLTGLLIWVIAIIAVGFKGATLIKVGIVFFLVTMLFTLFSENGLAEGIGNGIYYIFATGIILLFIDQVKKKK